MKTFVTTSIFAGVVSATLPKPAHLHPRQAETALPSHCDKILEDVAANSPTEPPIIPEFSSSYYETVSRTAAASTAECAWITDMPEPVREAFRDYSDTLMDSVNDIDRRKKIQAIPEECRITYDESDVPCQGELRVFYEQSREAGWKPKTYQDYSQFLDDDDSAASGLGIQTYAAIALLASFVGTIAFL